MPVLNVQVHHLVIFVLVIFSFNVFLLAYLTGALSTGSVLKLKSLLAGVGVTRPPPKLPPWERPDFGQVTEPVRKHVALPKDISLDSCTLGLWQSSTITFCKRGGSLDWIEIREKRAVAMYREIWMRIDEEEAAIFDHTAGQGILLKRSVAFRGKGRTSDEAIRKSFDEVYAKDGRFATLKESSPRVENEAPSQEVEDNNDEQGDDENNNDEDNNDNGDEGEENNEEEEAQEDQLIVIADPGRECSMFWAKKDEVSFCKIANSQADWVEIDTFGQVKFRFKELYAYSDRGEVGLFDESRLIVITLLRRYGLIGYPDSVAEAERVARETDIIFFTGGGWQSDKVFKPIPPRVTSAATEDAKVMVMISAYRDALCSNTLKELFENAYSPSRVHVAVVNQANVGDIDCLDDYCREVGEDKCRRNQINEIRIPMDRSRGVMFARFMQQTLIQDEEFCLQIDAHMVFPKNWDRLAIEDWLGAENEMAVMTTYPNRAKDRNNQKYSPVRCNTVWGSRVVACGTSAHNIEHRQKSPHLSAFFGAGIAFSKCHANLVVPYDPYMAFLFKGEEYNRSSRLWTHGYDLYAPKKNYAYHFYDDDPRPDKYKDMRRDRSFFGSTSDSDMLLRQSEYRWQAIMGMIPTQQSSATGPAAKAAARKERLRKSSEPALKDALLVDVDLFGLGTKRSLREYEIFSGINLAKHTNKDLCDQIGKLPWVPWDNTGYAPMGKNCPEPTNRKCCKTTMDLALKSGGFLSKYIEMTNSDWASLVRQSEVVSQNKSEALFVAPIRESRGWSGTAKVC